MAFVQSELEPSDIIVIAGEAGGLDPRTVDKYFRGLNTRRRKREAIEAVLRKRGEPWVKLIRKRSG